MQYVSVCNENIVDKVVPLKKRDQFQINRKMEIYRSIPIFNKREPGPVVSHSSRKMVVMNRNDL